MLLQLEEAAAPAPLPALPAPPALPLSRLSASPCWFGRASSPWITQAHVACCEIMPEGKATRGGLWHRLGKKARRARRREAAPPLLASQQRTPVVLPVCLAAGGEAADGQQAEAQGATRVSKPPQDEVFVARRLQARAADAGPRIVSSASCQSLLASQMHSSLFPARKLRKATSAPRQFANAPTRRGAVPCTLLGRHCN